MGDHCMGLYRAEDKTLNFCTQSLTTTHHATSFSIPWGPLELSMLWCLSACEESLWMVPVLPVVGSSPTVTPNTLWDLQKQHCMSVKSAMFKFTINILYDDFGIKIWTHSFTVIFWFKCDLRRKNTITCFIYLN
jgi:hypothetical protein